jgi:hypothetical protein
MVMVGWASGRFECGIDVMRKDGREREREREELAMVACPGNGLQSDCQMRERERAKE